LPREPLMVVLLVPSLLLFFRRTAAEDWSGPETGRRLVRSEMASARRRDPLHLCGRSDLTGCHLSSHLRQQPPDESRSSRSHKSLAEADGNRTRPPGIARRTGFEVPTGDSRCYKHLTRTFAFRLRSRSLQDLSGDHAPEIARKTCPVAVHRKSCLVSLLSTRLRPFSVLTYSNLQ
jgi:hypothetical protein